MPSVTAPLAVMTPRPSSVLKQLDQAPPSAYAHRNGRWLAEALQDVSPDHIWQLLRQHRVQLAQRRSWCVSTDPEFVPKAADIMGLCLNSPEKPLVISVDEKPHIQALERAQGYLKLPNGRALRVHFHFTLTQDSWLNQIEIWFSILSRSALKGASFTSVRQLRQAIDGFIEVYNPRAARFEWKKSRSTRVD